MSAKVGNIGGGMVELFSFNGTDAAAAKVTHQFTNAEVEAFKNYCDEYDLLCFELKSNYTSSISYYDAVSATVSSQIVLDYLNATTYYRRCDIVRNDQKYIQLSQNGDLTALRIEGYILEGYGVSNASTTLKIYGIKL